MRKSTICSLAATLLISATTAFGAVKEGSFSLTPLVGGYVFEHDQDLDPTLVVGIRGGYNFTKHIGVEALYDYITSTDATHGPVTDVSGHRFGGQALYHFFPDNVFVPYLAAGFSGLNFNGNAVNVPTRTHGAFDYGIGAKLFLADDFAIRGDVRHIMYGYNSGDFNNIEFSLGAYFQFGATPPLVKAVTPPPAPAAEPPQAVAVPTPVQTHAAVQTPAPLPAPAQVTIVPVLPVDSDHDGVVDTLDKCPGTPAGVSVDRNGCPAEVAKRFCDKPAVIAISFDANKSAIKARYIEELARVGNFLKDFPTAKGTIEGHTDAVGSRKTNQKLSQARAETVRDYIISNFGIDGSRISAKGYGFTRPVASNKTVAGKARNRRIEAVFTCE